MAPTLKIDGTDFFNYLRVGPGEGFDPADADFREPQFGDSLISDGQPLISVNQNNREMQWPLHLNAGGPTRRNLWNANPSAENAASWNSAGDYVVTRVASGTNGVPSHSGSWMNQHTYDGTSTPSITMGSRNITFPNAGVFIASCYVWIPTGYDGGVPQFDFSGYSGSTGEVRGRNADLTKKDQWQRIWSYITIDVSDFAGTMQIVKTLAEDASSALTGTFYTDDIMIEEWTNTGTPTPSEWFDGYSDPRAWWEGTPYTSVSQIGGKDGLHRMLREINKTLAGAQMVEWADDGATDSTFYDVQFARFEPDYNYRRAQVNWLSGVLRVWTKPYGHTGTYRSSTTVTGSLGLPVFMSAASVNGDTNALLRAQFNFPSATSALDPFSSRIIGLSVMPTTMAGFVPAASIAAVMAGEPSSGLFGASGAAGSQVFRMAIGVDALTEIADIQYDASAILLPPGRHRLLGLVRLATGNASSLQLGAYVPDPGPLGNISRIVGATQEFTSQGNRWTVVDFGVFSRATYIGTSAAPVILAKAVKGAAGSQVVEMSGMLVLPEGQSIAGKLFGNLHDSIQLRHDGHLGLASGAVNARADQYMRGAMPELPVASMQKLMIFSYEKVFGHNYSVTASYDMLERFTYAR